MSLLFTMFFGSESSHLLEASENVGNPVLTFSGTGDESVEIRSPNIEELDVNTWIQFYMARSGAGRLGIKYATSPKSDPHNWTKDNNIIVSSGSWDDEIAGSAAIKESGTWYLFYDNWTSGTIGVASGANLASLTKHDSGNSAIIDNTGSATFDKYLRHPSIIKVGSTFYLYLEARADSAQVVGFKNTTITYYTSTDLINWTRSGVDLFPNTSWSTYYYALNMPTIKFYNGIYHMFMIAGVSIGGFARTGPGLAYAVSDNPGSGWQIVSNNKWGVYKRGIEENWDDSNRQEPELFLIDDDNLFLYYNGRRETSGSASNGLYNLSQGQFNDVLPSAIINESFPGVSLPTNWTKAEQGGITVTVNDGLTIVADGTQVQSSVEVLRYDLAINTDTYPYFSLGYILNMSPFNGSEAMAWELSDATQQNGIFILRRNTAGKIRIVLKISGSNVIDLEVDFTNNKLVKFSKDGGNAAFYEEGADTIFDLLESIVKKSFSNVDLFLKLFVENNTSNSVTMTINKITLLPYDYPLHSSYQ